MVTAEAVIHLPSLKHNYLQLKRLCHPRPLIAVIKGDAYGHNAIEVARTLKTADMFAVARIEEALELRDAGIESEILLLEGCFCVEDLIMASQHRFQVVIHHHFQSEQLISAELEQPVKVWLKVDTGMHRVGVKPEAADGISGQLQKSRNVAGEVNFLSHLSCADDLKCGSTTDQIEAFKAVTSSCSGLRSLANSAGLLFWPESRFDVVRAGIALYGISPEAGNTGQELGLRPVMTLRSKLIAIRDHNAGEPVGYSETWRSPKQTRIGVIAFGYGDGYPRLAPEGTPVWVNGREIPVVGRVSMDMITVDLGMDSQDKIGDEVELWGQNLPIEKVAKSAGTIPYELTIKLTSRVVRTYLS